MANNNDSDDDQDNIFRSYMQSDKKFRLLKDHKYITPDLKPTRLKPEACLNDSKKSPTITSPLSDNLWRPVVSAQDYISYFQPGLQHKTIVKLKNGQIPIQATLDLHTKTKGQAAILFNQFVTNSFDQQLRCICIIHGKGSRSDQTCPILKNLVNHWLYEFSDIILGFCSCPPHFGGTGAVLVFLKRNN